MYRNKDFSRFDNKRARLDDAPQDKTGGDKPDEIQFVVFWEDKKVRRDLGDAVRARFGLKGDALAAADQKIAECQRIYDESEAMEEEQEAREASMKQKMARTDDENENVASSTHTASKASKVGVLKDPTNIHKQEKYTRKEDNPEAIIPSTAQIRNPKENAASHRDEESEEEYQFSQVVKKDAHPKIASAPQQPHSSHKEEKAEELVILAPDTPEQDLIIILAPNTPDMELELAPETPINLDALIQGAQWMLDSDEDKSPESFNSTDEDLPDWATPSYRQHSIDIPHFLLPPPLPTSPTANESQSLGADSACSIDIE